MSMHRLTTVDPPGHIHQHILKRLGVEISGRPTQELASSLKSLHNLSPHSKDGSRLDIDLRVRMCTCARVCKHVWVIMPRSYHVMSCNARFPHDVSAGIAGKTSRRSISLSTWLHSCVQCMTDCRQTLRSACVGLDLCLVRECVTRSTIQHSPLTTHAEHHSYRERLLNSRGWRINY